MRIDRMGQLISTLTNCVPRYRFDLGIWADEGFLQGDKTASAGPLAWLAWFHPESGMKVKAVNERYRRRWEKVRKGAAEKIYTVEYNGKTGVFAAAEYFEISEDDAIDLFIRDCDLFFTPREFADRLKDYVRYIQKSKRGGLV